MPSDAGGSVALDSDVILKLACFQLLDSLGEALGTGEANTHILGAARFVLRNAIRRSSRIRDKEQAQRAVAAFADRVNVVEPTDAEIRLAAEIEERALTAGADVDAGESQLLAVTVTRLFARLLTGDKRAVLGIERLLHEMPTLTYATNRVVILEQLVCKLIDEVGVVEVRRLICAERDVDKALAICCSCYSPEIQPEVKRGLESYIADLSVSAPTALATGYQDQA